MWVDTKKKFSKVLAIDCHRHAAILSAANEIGVWNMKIGVIGSGYVGLVSGACFADFGHHVVCVDKDQSKIDRLNANMMPIYEPGLDALVKSNVNAGRLSFSTELAIAIKGCDAVFIAVGTPSRRGDGHADLCYVYASAREIGAAIDPKTVVITKSTVPVGTGDEVERIIREVRPDLEFAVVSNPEFLREGAAISDFKRPDRIVVGSDVEWARDVMRAIYRPFFLNETPILFTSRASSELIKYAANAFLATKITFINEMADLCEKLGADVQDVSRGIGLDGRIGAKFLHAGPGYGGSCFPKDTLALLKTAQDNGTPVRIVEAVVQANDLRKRAMGRKIVNALGGNARGKKVALLGLTFKPNTDDMRDAPSIAIVQTLLDAGAEIRAHDPEGMEEATKIMPEVSMAESAYAAAEGADAIVIVTEWDAYRALDLTKLRASMKGDVLVDLRNIYRPEEGAKAGFDHIRVGSKQ
jgi:UDPglucose 6-dehydrogenase